MRNILGQGCLHCKEDCLVFRKIHQKDKCQEIIEGWKVPNVIITIPTGTSQKPFQIYDYIEGMCKEGKGGFLEIFARPRNQREGWVGIGNEAISTFKEKAVAELAASQAPFLGKRKPLAT